MKLDRPFTPGATVLGRLTFAGYEHVSVEIQIERIEPEGYFSYRWHPYAIDPNIDYSAEPTTLVEFRLEETAGGTVILRVDGTRSGAGEGEEAADGEGERQMHSRFHTSSDGRLRPTVQRPGAGSRRRPPASAS
jgi:uncharacterized protein YndB with AHSA1/START domain